MIVPMKRLTLLCMEKDVDRVLNAVRDLGTVHVTSVQPPAGDDLEQSRQLLERAQKAQEIISREVDALSGKERQAAPTHQGRAEAADADQIIELVHELTKRQQDAAQLLEGYRFEIERLSGLGDFDPGDIVELGEKGVTVKLIQSPAGTVLSAPAGWQLQALGSNEHGAAFYALIGLGPMDLSGLDLGGPFTEFRLPQRSTSQLMELAEQVEKEMGAVSAELAGLGAYMPSLSERASQIEERVAFLEVREGMGDVDRVAYLKGYIPADGVERLRTQARDIGCAVVAETPRAGENVPTLIQYPKVVRPIKTMFDVLKILPSYWETDVSWTFLLFFTVFVGMLIGDGGYGLLLVAVAAYIAISKKGVSRSALVMLLLLGISVTVFGAMSGSWLGIAPLPAFLEALKIPWLADNNNVMSLCFLIGAIHITIAHVWNVIEVFPRPQFLAQIGWTAIVWAMYFLANSVVLGQGTPSFMLYLLGVGVLLVVFFMTPPAELKRNAINHVLLPLTLVSFFVDIISYVRLFAVGVATVAVMDSFNGMAASIGFGNVLTATFAVLILIFGHSLNLVLAALAVLVHGVRLNTLEFSSHKGLSWSGNPFRPFARRS